MFFLKNALIFAFLITGAIVGFSILEASKKYKFKKDYYEAIAVVLGFFVGIFCAIYFLFRFVDFLNTVIPSSIR